MVSTIEEVILPEAFIYGTGDSNFTYTPNPNRLQGENPMLGFSNWEGCIQSVNDYSHLTNQDFIDWENDRLSLEAKVQQDSLGIAQSMFSLPIDRKMIKVIANINKDVQRVFLDENETPPTIDQMVTALENRLIGSSIQNATLSYIESVTSKSYATLKLTPLGKEKIWNYANQFMNNLATTWDARGQK